VRQIDSREALKQALDDPNIELQKLAAQGIAKIGVKDDFIIVAEKLKDNETKQTVKQVIVEYLAQFSRKQLANLEKKHAEAIAPAVLHAVPDLGQYVKQSLEEAAKAYVTALSTIGKGALPELTASIDKKNPNRNPLVRWVACKALGEIGPDVGRIVRDRLNLLGNERSPEKDKVSFVREAAREAVKKIDGSK
jgi:HEAT repeat protein